MSNHLRTPREVAAFYRVSLSAIHKWVATGQLKAVRVGNRLRFTQAELERFAGLKRNTIS